MSEDSNESSFSSFMQEQASEEPKGSIFGDNSKNEKDSPKSTADKIKQEEDDEKKKELEDAKKEAKANSQKYAAAQAGLAMAHGRQMMMALPFIIVGVIVLLIILTKGGTWLQNGTHFLVGKLRGE